MQFGHEKLDVYQLALKYVAWAYGLAKRLEGANRFARDQLLRASQSIQDILDVIGIIPSNENEEGKTMLFRIVSMLTMLGKRDYVVKEETERYFDNDNDNDNDF